MEDHRVVAVILRRGNQLLLCHRSPGRRWFPDVWDFPGGHVSNLQPEEHDAIGWFEEGQLDELRFADPSYLPLPRRRH
jgi:NUDIX domain